MFVPPSGLIRNGSSFQQNIRPTFNSELFLLQSNCVTYIRGNAVNPVNIIVKAAKEQDGSLLF